MPNVIHKTNRSNFKLLRAYSVNGPDYPTADWIHDPDLSGVVAVSEVYWKSSGNAIVAMDSGEQAAQDSAILAASQASTVARINENIAKRRPALNGIGWTLDITGLVLTLNVEQLVQDSGHTATSSGSLKTFVHAMLIHNTTSGVYVLKVRERTGGYYSTLAADEVPLFELGEWCIAPSGTVLVEAPDGAVDNNAFQHGRFIVTTASTIETITIVANGHQLTGTTAWTTVRKWVADTKEYADDPPNDLRIEARGVLKTTNGSTGFRIKGTEYIAGVAQTPAFYGSDSGVDTAGASLPHRYNKQPSSLQAGEVLFELQVQPSAVGVIVDLEGTWTFSFRRK